MFGREPTLWLGLVRAIVVGAVAFGLDLTTEQTFGIYLGAEAVVSFVNRSKVSPVLTEREYDGEPL